MNTHLYDLVGQVPKFGLGTAVWTAGKNGYFPCIISGLRSAAVQDAENDLLFEQYPDWEFQLRNAKPHAEAYEWGWCKESQVFLIHPDTDEPAAKAIESFRKTMQEAASCE